MQLRRLLSLQAALAIAAVVWLVCGSAKADEPKPKPENTISIQLGEPVPPQKFEHPPKFWISELTDRSGNPQPMLVTKQRGGVFLDKQPTASPRHSSSRNHRQNQRRGVRFVV